MVEGEGVGILRSGQQPNIARMTQKAYIIIEVVLIDNVLLGDITNNNHCGANCFPFCLKTFNILF